MLARRFVVFGRQAAVFAATKASVAARQQTRCFSTGGGAGEREEASALFLDQQAMDYQPSAWGWTAELYDRSFGTKFRLYAAAVLEDVNAQWDKHHSGGGGGGDTGGDSTKPQSLLDIGCGTGATFDALLQMQIQQEQVALHRGAALNNVNSIRTFTGVDFSGEMVDVCRRKHEVISIPDSASLREVQWAKANAENLQVGVLVGCVGRSVGGQ